MAMTGSDLAEAIRSEMGFSLPVSGALVCWGDGVVDEIQNGLVNNSAGTITGDCPPGGGALSNGAGNSGVVSNIDATAMASAIRTCNTEYTFISTELQEFCEEIRDHIQTSGIVIFASGDITGTCGNTIISPGILSSGKGINGKITNLEGNTLATNIHNRVYPSLTGPTSLLIDFCTALINYVEGNAEVLYASGSVEGDCPAGGGALLNGKGTNGIIL